MRATERIANADKVAVVKFFGPGRWTWFATEFDGDDLFFGYVLSGLGEDCDEWGYFSLSELEASAYWVKPGRGIERDLHWQPRPMREAVPSVFGGGEPGWVGEKVAASRATYEPPPGAMLVDFERGRLVPLDKVACVRVPVAAEGESVRLRLVLLENTLEAMQAAVGGYLEGVATWSPRAGRVRVMRRGERSRANSAGE